MSPTSDANLYTQSSGWDTSRNGRNSPNPTTDREGPGVGFYIGWVLVALLFLVLILWYGVRRKNRAVVEQEQRESSRRARQQQQDQSEKQSVNKGKSMLLKYFESNPQQMVLSSENMTFVQDGDVNAAVPEKDTTTAAGKDDMMEQGLASDVNSSRHRVELKLPSSLGPISTKGTDDNGGAGGEDEESQSVHLASNYSGCAICLELYKVNDMVVWSSNVSECPHVFHRSCVLDYWSTVKPKLLAELNHTPCPCCRRQFCLDFRFVTHDDDNGQSLQVQQLEYESYLGESVTDDDSDDMSSTLDEVDSTSVRGEASAEDPWVSTPTDVEDV